MKKPRDYHIPGPAREWGVLYRVSLRVPGWWAEMDNHTNALVHSFVIHFFRSRSAAISPSKVSAFLRNHHNRISLGLFELLDKVQRVDTKSQFCPWELCLLVANSFFCLLAGGHRQCPVGKPVGVAVVTDDTLDSVGLVLVKNVAKNDGAPLFIVVDKPAPPPCVAIL